MQHKVPHRVPLPQQRHPSLERWYSATNKQRAVVVFGGGGSVRVQLSFYALFVAACCGTANKNYNKTECGYRKRNKGILLYHSTLLCTEFVRTRGLMEIEPLQLSDRLSFLFEAVESFSTLWRA